MKDSYVQAADEETPIEVFYEKDESHFSLFNGLITKIKVNVVNYVYILSIEAKSLDYRMDIREEKKGFPKY